MTVIRSIIGVAFFSTMALLGSCSGKKNTGQQLEEDKPVTVSVSMPGIPGNTGNIIASGKVEAVETVNISTRVMGSITKIFVKTGDHVNSGQLLFTISNADILAKRAQVDANVAEAEALYQNAQKDYDRFTTLYKQQSATSKELDNITLQYHSAKAGLDAAKQLRNEINVQLSYTRITAPFSGIITQKMMDVGSMVSPGMSVLTLEQSGQLQVVASIPETEITAVQQGGHAVLNIKSAGKTITGTVSQIIPSAQFTGGQYLIKINVPDADKRNLYAGMYVNVTIPVPEAKHTVAKNDGILVPVSSIVQKGELAGVYTVGKNNRAFLRWVRLGKAWGDKVEVLSGLDKDEQFVLQADGKLYNGVPVKVK